MGSIKKLAGQTLIYGFSSIIGRLVGYALTPIYTKFLTQEEYGIFSDLYAFVTYFLVILTFGLETSYFRFTTKVKEGQEPYNQAFLFVLTAAFGFAALFGFGHPWVASFLGYGDRPLLVLMVVGIIALDVLVALPMAKLRFDNRPIIFAIISLFSIVVNITLNVIFILVMGMRNAEYIFLANLIASVVKIGLLLLVSVPGSKVITDRIAFRGRKLGQVNLLPSSLRLDRKVMKPMVNYGFFIMLAGLFGMINTNSDVNFIRRLWGEAESPFMGQMLNGEEMAGVYSACKKLAVFILLVTQAFRYAAEPFFFRNADTSDSRITLARVFHYFMMAALAVFLLVSSFSYEIVSFQIAGYSLIDNKFWGGLPVVPLLLFFYVLLGAYINLSIWFKLTNQVRFGVLFSGVGVAILVVLNFLLIPFWGFMGAAIAMVISGTVMCAMSYSFGQKYYPIPYHLNRIFVNFGVVMTAFWLNFAIGGQRFFQGGFWGKLGISVAALLALYLIDRQFPVNWKAFAKKQNLEGKAKPQDLGKDGGRENRFRDED